MTRPPSAASRRASRSSLIGCGPLAAGPVYRTLAPMTADVVPMVPLVPAGPLVSRIGLGLAALGRPAYITSGRSADLPDRSVAGLRAQTVSVLDTAYAAGVRYFDAARSYGRAEEFLGDWIAERGPPAPVPRSNSGSPSTPNSRPPHPPPA